MLCECCEKEEGVIDCKECSRVADQYRVLCVDCSAFIHRGAYKNHQLISPELKKKRDAVKEKMVLYKTEREWEQTMITNLSGVRKEIEERQRMYEEGLKHRVTEINQKLKQKAMVMLGRIQELTKVKLDYVDNLSKQVLENVKSGSEFETKMNAMIASISEFEKEMGIEETSKEYEDKLVYKFVEWDRAAFPELGLPLKIDYSAVEAAAELFTMELVENYETVQDTQEEETESKPSDVTLQSRIDQQGVFWIHVDFESNKNNVMEKLFDISYNIRTKYLLDREWKSYGKLGEKPQVGEIVYALWSEDDKWYRGRVDVLEDSQAQVVFCDFGNTAKIEYSKILPIQNHSVSDLPFQALESSLFPEPKEIPLNVKFEFTDMIAGGPLHCKVLGKVMFGAKEITHIELLKDMPDGSQLNLCQYLESRCQTKRKSDMPFTSRDIRLLENPNAFDKSKKTEESTEEKTPEKKESTKEDCEKEEETKPSEAEPSPVVNGEATPEATTPRKDEKLETPKKDEKQETPKKDEKPETPKKDETITNGTVEPTASESTDDIIIECQEVEEVFDLPIPSVYPGETLQLHYDPKNHPLNRDGTFWAMLHRNEHQNVEWERFKEALNKAGEKADQCTKISEGNVVLVFWKKSWHRAKVDSTNIIDQADGKPKVKVRITDQGTSCKMAENQLRVLPIKYLKVPTQGIKCSIANSKIKHFPKDSQVHFNKLVEGKAVTAVVKTVSSCTAKELCLEVSLKDFSDGKPQDIADLLYEREQGRQIRTQRHLDNDIPPPGPGVIHLKKEENWQDEFLNSGEHHLPALPTLPVMPLMQAGVEDGLVYDQHPQYQQQHPHHQQQQQQVHHPEQYVVHGADHYPGSYPDQYHQVQQSPQQQQQDMYGQQRQSQDTRSDHRQNDGRRNYRNDRGGQGGWRGGGDNRTCFKCGDPTHYSKNCPKQGHNQGQRRNRRT